jgi:hypothetical protein
MSLQKECNSFYLTLTYGLSVVPDFRLAVDKVLIGQGVCAGLGPSNIVANEEAVPW